MIKVCKLYENFSQYGKIMFVIIVFQDEKIAEIKEWNLSKTVFIHNKPQYFCNKDIHFHDSLDKFVRNYNKRPPGRIPAIASILIMWHNMNKNGDYQG